MPRRKPLDLPPARTDAEIRADLRAQLLDLRVSVAAIERSLSACLAALEGPPAADLLASAEVDLHDAEAAIDQAKALLRGEADPPE